MTSIRRCLIASSSLWRAGRSRLAPEKPPSSKTSRNQAPPLLDLAFDISCAGLALGVEGVEILVEAMIRRDPGIDGASPRRCLGGDRAATAQGFASVTRGPSSDRASWLPIDLARPKNLGPFHRTPVMARATCERLR
jgi:hypothetical protein